jgi:pimeloyl-ACP methyl ester carboxylesterase
MGCRRLIRCALVMALAAWVSFLDPPYRLAARGALARGAEPPGPPVLLVHGLAWELDKEDQSLGRVWDDGRGHSGLSGLIGFLHSKGLTYGGTIRPQGGNVELPEHLDTAAVGVQPYDARLFVLKFSEAANTDGVAYKALELAESIRQLCGLTGAEKVQIVAHSAGGVIARVYLQSALPGVPFRGDVDRLVTIATPHLGSAMADHLGDFLGTRATSIRPDAALMRNLNSKFELPDDVTFASIVVRGIAADVRGEGHEYDTLVDHRLLERLPVEYRVGGDQVVHVRSQNLRLAECAVRYEERTGRPVQYILARVPDPTRIGLSWKELADIKVHATAPFNGTVQELVFGLLKENAALWTRTSPERLTDWCDWQARQHARGVIESQALSEHPMSQASNITLDELEPVTSDGEVREYRFAGKAWSKNVALPLRRRWTHVRGTLRLVFDDFGRVVAAESHVEERKDE